MPHVRSNKKTARPLVSIVIINKREVEVDRTLDLIAKQKDAPDFEVVVIDASDGELDYIYGKYGFIKKVAYHNLSGKKITIPEQRNLGIDTARGSIVVFTDAGCEPVPTWLKDLTAPIINGKEVIVAGGTLSTGGPTAHDVTYRAVRSKKYLDYAPTINLALSRPVLDNVGYFDESLPAGEDVDYSWRCKDAGYRIFNQQKALVTHDWGNAKREAKRGYRYGKAEVDLCRKYHLSMLNFAKRKLVPIVYVLFLVGLLITPWLPWYPLFILVPIAKNANAHPIRALAFSLGYSVGLVKQMLLR